MDDEQQRRIENERAFLDLSEAVFCLDGDDSHVYQIDNTEGGFALWEDMGDDLEPILVTDTNDPREFLDLPALGFKTMHEMMGHIRQADNKPFH